MRTNLKSANSFVFIGVVILGLMPISPSCINEENQMESGLLTISEENNPSYFSDLFNIEKTIKLKTTDSCLINIVFKVEITDNLIFAFSGNQVFAFDYSGNFIHKIGKMGKGPNEMLNPLILIWHTIKSKLLFGIIREVNLISSNWMALYVKVSILRQKE